MKSPVPQSLVQVHYHDRLSGVNKVIGLYAEAFSRLHKGRAAPNIVVCGKSKKPQADFSPARTFSVPFCDYQEFSKKSQFEFVKASLVGSLGRVLKSQSVKLPVSVIGHNLSIGKNCALSSAFAEIARQYGGNNGAFRFYSVIHDFAEEGRLDCLKEIENVKKWVDIENDLFPSPDVVRLIILNSGNASILEKAGFPAFVLNDPVEDPGKGKIVALGEPFFKSPSGDLGGANERKPITIRTLSTSTRLSASLSKGAYFQQYLPIILYPSRCISRKNMLEAILACNFIYKSNLLIGATGTDEKDLAAFKMAVKLSKNYKLPILFDYGRFLTDTSTKGVFTNKAFDRADACITTSIAEGFGYGLYEPWLYGKAVFGRKHPGFEPVAGVKFEGLYDQLPIPIKWVSIVYLRQKYWETMQKCFGRIENNELLSNGKKFDRAFTDYFIKDNTIDFGCLDSYSQFKIVESLLKEPRKMEEWDKVCGKQLSKIRKNADRAVFKSQRTIQYNQARINKYLSMKSFSKEFGKILSQKPPEKVKTGCREEILREFCAFERFRLLLAK
jgi:hypothetical protein